MYLCLIGHIPALNREGPASYGKPRLAPTWEGRKNMYCCVLLYEVCMHVVETGDLTERESALCLRETVGPEA